MILKLLVLLLTSQCTSFSIGFRGAARTARAATTSLSVIDPCDAPGDPSLILTTNVALDDKPAFVKAASAAVAECLSKPETYVAVCVTDSHEAMSFGGSTVPSQGLEGAFARNLSCR